MDVHGNILNLSTKRNIKKNEVVSFIAKFGIPLIISSDVNPLPRTVEKIASSFGCKVFYPEESLSVQEKHKLTKFFSKKIKSDHELDALAASIRAWKKYRKLLSRIESVLKERGLLLLYHQVALKLLKEETGNINQAIDKILMKEKYVPRKIKRKEVIDEEIIKKLESKLHKKDEQLKNLKRELQLLSKKLLEMKMKLQIYQKMKISLERVKKLERENEKLRKYSELLKKLESLEGENLVPIIEVSDLSSLYLEELDKFIGLKNRVIFSSTNKNINILNNFMIRALVVKELPDRKVIGKLEFPIILFDSSLIKRKDQILVIERNRFETLLNKVRKNGLIEWLKRYRKRI